jgi:hypothetical protein
VDHLPDSLQFNPHWIFDPAVWRIIDEVDKAAAARIQIQLVRETLAAQVKAVDEISGLLER